MFSNFPSLTINDLKYYKNSVTFYLISIRYSDYMIVD